MFFLITVLLNGRIWKEFLAVLPAIDDCALDSSKSR